MKKFHDLGISLDQSSPVQMVSLPPKKLSTFLKMFADIISTYYKYFWHIKVLSICSVGIIMLSIFCHGHIRANTQRVLSFFYPPLTFPLGISHVLSFLRVSLVGCTFIFTTMKVKENVKDVIFVRGGFWGLAGRI